MMRIVSLAGGLAVAAMAASALPAAAQRYEVGMVSNARGEFGGGNYQAAPLADPWHARTERERLSARRADQIVRWGGVGRCVAAADRDASLAYVTARRGSPEVRAASRRLDPVFASCLASAGVVARGNQAIRRAAVADALGTRLPDRT